MSIAFRPRSSDDAHECFGVVAVGPDDECNIGEALASGGGYIITDSDSLLAARLADHPGLEQVDAAVAHKAQKSAKAEAKAEKKES
jgi:hypothetical protein